MSVEIEGKVLTFETGKIARQANGAVLVRCEDTLVFTSACASPKPLPDIDFLPLRVDYQEKLSSVGKTPGGFIKREGRPAEQGILASRLIDRSLRPLFEEGYHHDVQILSYVWSYDGANTPDVLAICAASAALSISDIPFIKPIAGVRVGFVDGAFVVNPTAQQQKRSELDLVLAGTADAILMIEGSCNFLTEEEVLEAIERGHRSIRTICQAIGDWQSRIGKSKCKETVKKLDTELIRQVDLEASFATAKALKSFQKAERDDSLMQIEKGLIDKLCAETATTKYAEADVKAAFKNLRSTQMRQMILNENIRCDGRSTTQIRPINIEQGMLPRAHGSSLFTRGETQTLAICVLGGESMAQRFEDLDGEGIQRFYLQYFFPPFSVGEVGRIGAPGRREVGHGKLAERALQATLPRKEVFPYTIRLESNITESNGSSSMASVCGGCLALMDAGVPITRPVSGIAMGLILEEKKYAVLSDILGVEDALGDMDFKITGDDKGITAFQMDIKVEGITIDIMRQALAQAKEGRIHILDKMLQACPKSRQEMSIYAPRIETVKIHPSKIGLVIGPGGKQIRSIIEQTGAEIDINDDGLVSISAMNQDAMQQAKNIITGLTAEAEIGKVYEGRVVSIVNFGLFIEILPGKEGLCHISELDVFRIENIDDYTKGKIRVGDTMAVMVTDITDRGQIKLSRKILLQKEQEKRHARLPAAG